MPLANFNSGKAVPVASYAPSGRGLYDMTGNVSEWTSTPGPYNASAKFYFVKGGSYIRLSHATERLIKSILTVNYTGSARADWGIEYTGFRCAK